MPTDSWRKALLNSNATLHQAIGCLENSSLQIAIVVAEDGRLIGTLTDGDIRRGLLRGLVMDSTVESIIYKDPLVVPPQWGRETVLQLMQANKIHQLPVVDDNRFVVGLHLWSDILTPNIQTNVMVIMAGGRGTRLGGFTDNCPKPMLPIGGKPMLEHIIERAKAEGFKKFILTTHYLGQMIEDYFEDGSKLQVTIEYLRESTPLGTAGALGLLSTRPIESFLVTNGDVLTDIRYGEMLDFHHRHIASATMAVLLHEWQNPFGVVNTKGVDIIGFEEKPVARSHINAGIYVLEPDILDLIDLNERCDMPLLFSRVQEKAFRTIVYPMHEPWLDVGRPTDLENARNSHFALEKSKPL
jgi:dTDP-glucose pyrophosphorylase